MAQVLPQVQILPLVVRLKPIINLTDDQLYEFCRINSELRIERTVEGELLIMPPAGGEPSYQNAGLTTQLTVWAKQDGTGVAFDSSGGFILPNGAMRSPDAAWVLRSRLAPLTREQKKRFIPLCPDFVIELRSPSDSLSALHAKMEEYIANGVQLGWLIGPEDERVYVYRPRFHVQSLEKPLTLSGGPILAGFVLDLKEIWEPEF